MYVETNCLYSPGWEKNEVYRTDQTKHHNTLIANQQLGAFTLMMGRREREQAGDLTRLKKDMADALKMSVRE